MRITVPQAGDTTLCQECGYPVVAFEDRGMIRWRHVSNGTERHDNRRLRKDPRAWIIRGEP